MNTIKFKQIGENGVHIHYVEKKEIFILEDEEFFKLLKEFTNN